MAAKNPEHRPRKAGRTHILGVRMSSEMMAEVKAEAVRRNLPVAKLFEEIWALYQKKRK